MSRYEPQRYLLPIVYGADQIAFGLQHFVFNTKDMTGEKLKVQLVESMSMHRRWIMLECTC